jgi:predicted ATP-grasp superfamily ATP-dependent carboligase
MRLFVYEYTCAARLRDHLSAASLQSEGMAMLSAIVEDLTSVPGVEVSALVAEGIADHLPSLRSCHVNISSFITLRRENAFRELARCADGTLIIAPEFDDLLFDRCRLVEAVGGRLLGPSSEAVRLTSDKWALAHHWTAGGIPTPVTALVSSGSVSFPAVLKPRYGAGSLATFRVGQADEVATCAARAEQEGWREEMILQSFVRGLACSVSFLVGPAETFALAPCKQHLSDDGRFRYLGGSLPLTRDLMERAVKLGRRAVESVAGLLGYVGIDLVLGDACDGSADVVIEINPRLTTSYIGLRALATTNLAEALLQVVEGHPSPVLGWRSGSVVFHTDGRAIWSRCAVER